MGRTSPELASHSFPRCFAGAPISILKGLGCVTDQRQPVQKAEEKEFPKIKKALIRGPILISPWVVGVSSRLHQQ